MKLRYIWGAALVTGVASITYIDGSLGAAAQLNCQYPDRPTNTAEKCDNSDPAIPGNWKGGADTEVDPDRPSYGPGEAANLYNYRSDHVTDKAQPVHSTDSGEVMGWGK